MTITELKQLPNELLKLKIKSILFSIGFNEKYIAFEYLSYIIMKLVISEDESSSYFKKTIILTSSEYHVSNRTITQGLNKILKSCNNDEIKNRMQFNLNKNCTLNRIRVLKNYSQTHLF